MNITKTNTPLAFAAPAQELLYQQYGDPRKPGWEGNWMHRWHIKEEFAWFPQAAIYLHRDFEYRLRPALRALEENGCFREIKTFDGCFSIRFVRGGYSVLSIHSWGVAMDLNAADNPLGSNGKWSHAFIQTMMQHNIYCGQNWRGRKDPMHFALVNG